MRSTDQHCMEKLRLVSLALEIQTQAQVQVLTCVVSAE